MLDIYDNILLTVAFLNIILGILVLRRNWKDYVNFSYIMLTATIVIWSFSLFLFRSSTSPEFILLTGRLVYATASFLPFFFLAFVFAFSPLGSFKKTILTLLGIPALLFAALSFGTNLMAIKGFRENNLSQLEFGVLYRPFLFYLTLYSVSGLIYLFIKVRHEKDIIKKLQYRLVLIGIGITTLVGTITNGFLLTTFAFKYNWVGPIGTLVMMIFFAYAIVQYKLFQIKVVSAQIFSGILSGLLFIKLLSSVSIIDIVVNSIIFVGSSMITILLLKSMLNEIRTREEIEKLAQKLEVANVELKRLDKAKSEFISIASHQLRTPLSIIKGYISLIRDGNFGEVSEAVQKTMNKIYLSNERLIKLVADMLDLSHMESGKLQYEFTNFNFNTLIASIADEFKIPIDDKGLTMTLHIPKEPINAWGDSWKLRQVIFNLIDNSLKYTKEGSIDLSAKKDDNSAILVIKDTGVGMTQETMDSLFQKFSRGKDSYKINAQGSGLGLFIAKKIVEDHHGELSIASEGEGKGSSFTLKIPMKKPDESTSIASTFGDFVKSI